jgi:hypothetical protein
VLFLQLDSVCVIMQVKVCSCTDLGEISNHLREQLAACKIALSRCTTALPHIRLPVACYFVLLCQHFSVSANHQQGTCQQCTILVQERHPPAVKKVPFQANGTLHP